MKDKICYTVGVLFVCFLMFFFLILYATIVISFALSQCFGVFSAAAVSSVAGNFSLFSITAAFLFLEIQDLTCYTIFRVIQ